jgi:hypothetical protein
MTGADFERLQVSESDLEMVTGGVGAAFDESMLADSETTITSTTIIRNPTPIVVAI